MGAAVFIALVLFATGGVTAYMGDRLGSYIGKKRHSTFGLRPRHTAMLWTVVSGGAIAVGTLLVLLALDTEFRAALLRGPQLVSENQSLDVQNRTLTRRNRDAERQAQADGARAASAESQADHAQWVARQAQRTLQAVRGELGTARVTLTRSRATLAQRQAALASAQAELGQARTGLGHTRQDLARAQARVREARVGVAQARLQLQAANDEVVRASKNVLALGMAQDRLHTENAGLLRQNRAQLGLLQASQGHTLVYRRSEELGRTVVAAAQSPDALRRELAVFLDGVELAARQRGAGGLDNAPAVVIPAFGDRAGREADAREAALDALTQNIAAGSGFMPSVVVVADARFNTFRGEAVKLDLKPYANVMVFPKGLLIASAPLDGSQPEDVILKRLQAFLTGRVRGEALARGIIPVHDPQSGEALVGQPIESATTLSLVEQAQDIGPDARITATAAEDTYSGDLLRLELRVAPGGADGGAKPAAQATSE